MARVSMNFVARIATMQPTAIGDVARRNERLWKTYWQGCGDTCLLALPSTEHAGARAMALLHFEGSSPAIWQAIEEGLSDRSSLEQASYDVVYSQAVAQAAADAIARRQHEPMAAQVVERYARSAAAQASLLQELRSRDAGTSNWLDSLPVAAWANDEAHTESGLRAAALDVSIRRQLPGWRHSLLVALRQHDQYLLASASAAMRSIPCEKIDRAVVHAFLQLQPDIPQQANPLGLEGITHEWLMTAAHVAPRRLQSLLPTGDSVTWGIANAVAFLPLKSFRKEAAWAICKLELSNDEIFAAVTRHLTALPTSERCQLLRPLLTQANCESCTNSHIENWLSPTSYQEWLALTNPCRTKKLPASTAPTSDCQRHCCH